MIINQFHSIGDILFIEPICRKILERTGKKPILPVRDHLMWLSNHIDSADFVPMSTYDINYESMEISSTYYPLRFANQIVRGLQPDDHSDYANCMPDKYELVGMDVKSWLDLKIRINADKCNALMSSIGITKHDEYILVNNHSQAGTVSIHPSNPENLRIVEMKEIPGYTVLDWSGVMIFAREIHTVSTCVFYILQALYNQYLLDAKCFIYPRPNEDRLLGVSKLPVTYNCKLVNMDGTPYEI